MMYKTHVKIGQTAYNLSIPALMSVGLMPNIVTAVQGGDVKEIAMTTIALGASVLVGTHGAIWGSGFPDIDHPTSTPARKNPILAKIFQACGVKHRGKYSHSIDMVTLTFILLYSLVGMLFNTVNVGNYALIETVKDILQVWIVSAYVGALFHLLADSLTKSGVRMLFFLPEFKLVLTKMNTAILTVVLLTITGLVGNVLNIKEYEVSQMGIMIISILVAFVVSNYMYVLVNGAKGNKENKTMKLILAMVSMAMLIATYFSNGLVDVIIINMSRVVLASVFITTALPGIDYFKTGDDSKWEKLVRGIFTWLLPATYVIIPLFIAFIAFKK